MAEPVAKPQKLPPPSSGQVWREFLKWVLGVPALCLGGLAIIWGALWLMGGQDMIWQTTQNMGTALFWIAAIALMYPLMLFVWVSDLRAGLLAAREWDAMSPEARAAAIAEAAVAQPKRRTRKMG